MLYIYTAQLQPRLKIRSISNSWRVYEQWSQYKENEAKKRFANTAPAEKETSFRGMWSARGLKPKISLHLDDVHVLENLNKNHYTAKLIRNAVVILSGENKLIVLVFSLRQL